jgi:hypothetical protein
MNYIFALALSLFLSHPAHAARDRKSPNYEKYLENADYLAGRRMVIGGVTAASVIGSIGLAVLTVGALQNTCAGSFGDSKEKCRANAEEVMQNGVITTIVGLGIGIPLIVIGQTDLRKARQQIDEESKKTKGFVKIDTEILSQTIVNPHWISADARRAQYKKPSYKNVALSLPVLSIVF